jgi:undecaprenyl-diphosphatase
MRLPAADRWLLLGLLAVLAAATVLTVAVGIAGTPLAGEARTIREIQGWPFPGQTLSDLSRAITTTGIVILLGCLLAAGLFVTGERREALVLLALLFVLSWLQPAIKELIDRPRPTSEMFDIRADITSPSYPAGHVMSPTALNGYAIVLCTTMPWPRLPRIAIAASCAAVLVLAGVVQVWLGVHWPSDVAGGYLWGASLVLAAILLSRWIARRLEAHPTAND